MSFQAVQLPSDDPTPQELIDESIDRYVRRSRDPLGNLMGDERFTCAVSKQRGIQDYRMRWQVRDLGEQLAERARRQVRHRESIFITAELPSGLFDEPRIKFRGASDENHACGVGVDRRATSNVGENSRFTSTPVT